MSSTWSVVGKTGKVKLPAVQSKSADEPSRSTKLSVKQQPHLGGQTKLERVQTVPKVPTQTVQTVPKVPTQTVPTQTVTTREQSREHSREQPSVTTHEQPQTVFKMKVDYLRASINGSADALLRKWGPREMMKLLKECITSLCPTEEDLLTSTAHMYESCRLREDELAEPSEFIKSFAADNNISIEAAVDKVLGKPIDWITATTSERDEWYYNNREREDEYDEYFDNIVRSARDMMLRPHVEFVREWYYSPFNTNITIIRKILMSDPFYYWNTNNSLITQVFNDLKNTIKRVKHLPKYCIRIDINAANKSRSEETRMFEKVLQAIQEIKTHGPDHNVDLEDTVTRKMAEVGFAYGDIVISGITQLMDMFGIMYG